jgi:hypothetical protein
MTADWVRNLIRRVDQTKISERIRYLAEDPLPCRRSNYTLPGHSRSTLEETDDYLENQLRSWGYTVEREEVPVQAFRRDRSKPLAHQYSPPDPKDSWYKASNLYAKKRGARLPDEVVVVVAHKDSQSWMDRAPGAYDNAAGTAGVLEVARVLADCTSVRSLWFLFCNEEHWPWTSETAARKLAESGLKVTGVLNVDSIGGKSPEDRRAGRMINTTRFTTPEGEALADFIATLNKRYGIGLTQRKHGCDAPEDDDGSFIKAGIPNAVMMVGSYPYSEPHYHTEEDTPGVVDMLNVKLATRLCLATVAHLDRDGNPGE